MSYNKAPRPANIANPLTPVPTLLRRPTPSYLDTGDTGAGGTPR